ncbi:hypothetical protein CGU41_22545 [Pseudomonas aeruginosa]|nr:hypothetical protein CGU41_22545 [Pseudomonas aeruginosa]
MLALASVLGVGEGHLLHRETRWVESGYFCQNLEVFFRVSLVCALLLGWHYVLAQRYCSESAAVSIKASCIPREERRYVAPFFHGFACRPATADSKYSSKCIL